MRTAPGSISLSMEFFWPFQAWISFIQLGRRFTAHEKQKRLEQSKYETDIGTIRWGTVACPFSIT